MRVRSNTVNPTNVTLYCDNAFDNGNLGDASKTPTGGEYGHAEPAEWIRAEGHRLVPYCRSCMESLIETKDSYATTPFASMPAWRIK